jgi:SAM-dependent methyltransferase
MEADELKLLFEVFEDTPRQGPGSVESTRRAFRLLPDSLQVERVLDLGCGTGGSTIVLAQESGAHITAVDIHPPFLATLRARADELGLADRITTVCADMADAASLGTGFDLIWAEGSAYSIGFENALHCWRPLLRSGGCLVVTELVWFVAKPDERARAFFADECPDLRDEATRIEQARKAGYEVLGSFRLPAEDWHAYYRGLELPLRDAIARRGERDVYATLRREGEIYKTCGDDYGKRPAKSPCALVSPSERIAVPHAERFSCITLCTLINQCETITG